MSDIVAQQQIRAFVERILRLKEEAKSINDDIKEVYAEAKGNGFDKTVLGKLVNYVEKRAKSADTLAEQDALFDLYLSAYDGVPSRDFDEEDERPSRTHAHAREADHHSDLRNMVPSHDPITGEIADETPMSHASGQPGGDDPETPDDAASAGEDGEPIRRMSMTPLEPREAGGLKGFGFTVRFDEPEAAMLPQTGAVETLVANSEAADLATVTVAEAALVPRVAAASEPIADISKPNPICRDPEDCGVYASWHLTCEACKRAAAHRVAA